MIRLLLLLFLYIVLYAYAQDFSHICYTPFNDTMLHPHHFHTINFTAYDHVSLLVYENVETIFRNTNIPPGIVSCNAEPFNITNEHTDFNIEVFKLCLSENDPSCGPFGHFHIKYSNDVDDHRSLRKILDATIITTYLKPGDKSYFRVPYYGSYCILCYDHDNSWEDLQSKDGVHGLQFQSRTQYRGLHFPDDAVLYANIAAFLVEFVLILHVNKFIRGSKQGIERFNPFRFMIRLLLLKAIENSLSSFILLHNIYYSNYSPSSTSKALVLSPNVITTLEAITIYQFVAFNDFSFTPWNYRLLKDNSFLFVLSSKVIITLSEVYKVHVLPASFINKEDLLRACDFSLNVLYYLRSQETENHLSKNDKKCSRRFRLSRIFLVPLLIAYKAIGELVSVFIYFFIAEVLRTEGKLLIEDGNDDEPEYNYLVQLVAFILQRTTDCLYENEKFIVPLLILGLVYIWKPILEDSDDMNDEPLSVEDIGDKCMPAVHEAHLT